MNVDLAPVVDVVRPESALHTEGRGFGFTAASAARFGAAFTRGLRAGGVAAAAKHFPGFGAAPAQHRHGAVRIGVGLRELRAVDRRPFRPPSAPAPAWSCSPARSTRRCRPRPRCSRARVVQRELRARPRLSRRDDLRRPRGARLRPARRRAPAPRCSAARAGVDLLLYARTYEGADRAARTLTDALRSGRVDRAALEESHGAHARPAQARQS